MNSRGLPENIRVGFFKNFIEEVLNNLLRLPLVKFLTKSSYNFEKIPKKFLKIFSGKFSGAISAEIVRIYVTINGQTSVKILAIIT